MVPLLIPEWSPGVLWLGPVPVDPWATLVAVGFVLGLEVARARGIRHGLDTRDVVDGAVFIVLMGFVVGHLVHVLAYNRHQLEDQGVLALLRIWAGFSSFGGFLGAVLGGVAFYRAIVPWRAAREAWRLGERQGADHPEATRAADRARRLAHPHSFWRHADVVMYGFPFAYFFGRLGCFAVHDHIGKPSTFFLAVDFERYGPRHDLGLYEALLMLAISTLFWILGRRLRPAGLFMGLWSVIYAPCRFFFDSLRNTDLPGSLSDERWAGLTPAQWGCLVLLGLGVWILAVIVRRPQAPEPGLAAG